MHPVADKHLVLYFQRLGAAGDARVRLSIATGDVRAAESPALSAGG
jgi:hypothetical protein